MFFFGWRYTITITLCYLTYPVKSVENTCTNIEYFSSLHAGYVKNSEFLHFVNTTVLSCARQCQLRRRCASFNFFVTSGSCLLNENSSTDVGSQVDTVPNSVYSDVGTWPNRLAGACASHTCPENAECRETTSGGFACEITSCVDPPAVYSGKLNLTSRFMNFHETVPFTCIDGHAPRGTTTCSPDGSWEGTSECLPLQSCSHVKACNPSYPDGEYLIHNTPDLSIVMKIYCHDMAGTPTEFITLTNTYTIFADEKISQTCGGEPWQYEAASGKTNYERVRINHWDLVAHRRDYTFANSQSQPSAPLGYAWDCRDCESKDASAEGSFRINTTGTGFKIASNVEWTSVGGNAQITRSANGLVTEGVCRGGCALCTDTGAGSYNYGFQLELDPSYDPRLSTATYPTCELLHGPAAVG